MDNNSHIKIHFYGQYWTENRSGQQAYDTIHRLTYPEVPSTEIAPSDSNVWMVLRDPRSDFGGRFPDAPMGYKLFRNDRGTYYSLITRNPHDFRAGYINITLLVDNGYHVHGS
ncbi:MAG: hypothetical protein IK092_04215, partial [Muribaculaceae bacterium]|nr:hypothetical protein [Muribaculaceae bacterium]